MREEKFHTLVIGSGPAGTGLLFNSLKKNQHQEFLGKGIAFVDAGENFCAGTIGNYIINSDTEGKVFLECLAHTAGKIPYSNQLRDMVNLITSHATSSIPLSWVGQYMKALGNDLRNLLFGHSNSAFLPRTQAIGLEKTKEGYILQAKEGEKDKVIHARSVVFALGGKQERENIVSRSLLNEIQLEKYDEKIMLTNDLFTPKGIEDARRLLSSAASKKVVVIGSSHSALSSLGILLNNLGDIPFEKGDITLMHRNKLKVYYPGKEQAAAENYFDFSDGDICPVTKKVHRLGGLRLDSRELLKKLLGISGGKEERVQLVQLRAEEITRAEKQLEEATLVIPAFGYKPRTIPVIENGRNTTLLCEGNGPLVNKFGQVLDSGNSTMPNLYGIGLASGFLPWGKMGGEASFTGQTNGLWLYQNDVGEIIYDQLMRAA